MAPVPGIITRFVQPDDPTASLPDAVLAPPEPVPGVEAFYVTEANDDLAPKYNIVYFVKDITPILESSSYYDADVKASTAPAKITWDVCSFLNGKDAVEAKELTKEPHVLPAPPVPGSTLVSNGFTPHVEWEQDYNDWYDQEHGHKLSLVPGWNSCRRYRHIKTYGETDVATFYGWNFYDAENGLGGPEWKASITPWTDKIRSQNRIPNLRRIWTVLRTSS